MAHMSTPGPKTARAKRLLCAVARHDVRAAPHAQRMMPPPAGSCSAREQLGHVAEYEATGSRDEAAPLPPAAATARVTEAVAAAAVLAAETASMAIVDRAATEAAALSDSAGGGAVTGAATTMAGAARGVAFSTADAPAPPAAAARGT